MMELTDSLIKLAMKVWIIFLSGFIRFDFDVGFCLVGR